ncbi:MAG TPA: twin-arginine translocation signal domain-containing protein, partial [Nitrospira sp.]|nr:twin-arginine translocation signal domain-containing protein [Nitrospira sp.]
MRKIDLSRRKFLGRTGTAALVLPLAAAIPAAIEATSPNRVEAAMENDEQQTIPNRATTARTIGTANQSVSLPASGDCSGAIQNAINNASTQGGGIVTIPYQGDGVCNIDIMAKTYVNPKGQDVYYGVKLANNVRLQAAPGVVIKAMPNHGTNPV